MSKTQAELEKMGFAPELAKLLDINSEHGFRKDGGAWHIAGQPIYAKGQDPHEALGAVLNAARLRQYPDGHAIAYKGYAVDVMLSHALEYIAELEHVKPETRAVLDVLWENGTSGLIVSPVTDPWRNAGGPGRTVGDVVPDGWEESEGLHTKGPASVDQCSTTDRFVACVVHDGWHSEQSLATISEAFTAADEMLKRLGLVKPDTVAACPEPTVEPPSGINVRCEDCGWTGTDTECWAISVGCACPECNSFWSITEVADYPPVTPSKKGKWGPKIAWGGSMTRPVQDGETVNVYYDGVWHVGPASDFGWWHSNSEDIIQFRRSADLSPAEYWTGINGDRLKEHKGGK